LRSILPVFTIGADLVAGNQSHAGYQIVRRHELEWQFAAALNVAVIALTTSLLMWLVAFLDVGGEWFLMWQSQLWNGQEEAFRMFTIVGVVFLVVVQREPTPD
jgi:predicted small integral membrane protein